VNGISRRLAVLVLALLAAAPAWAAEGCAPGLLPDAPPPGEAPAFRSWEKQAVPQQSIAACAGWGEWQPNLVAALSGRFAFDGTSRDLLARLGAISALKGVKYWSVHDQRYNLLITDASALVGEDGWSRRGDFTADDLAGGAARHFIQSDNRSTGGTVFRMQATAVSDDALRVAVRNTSAVAYLFVIAYEPGDVRSVHMLERAGPGVWRYSGLAGLRGAGLTAIGKGSAINRAVAMFRHLAGIPTDSGPPAALKD
jgi:hypothetical protein